MLRRLGTVILVLGVALVIATGGQYAYMAWRQYQLRAAALVPPPAGGATAPAATSIEGAQPLLLVIPSIHLSDAVVRGDGYEDLLVAPGLVPGSALPGDTGHGNTIIAAHRDTFFRGLTSLQPGDTVELFRGEHGFVYRVSVRRIVSPSDTSMLADGSQPLLTLVTCYPTYWIGPAPKRLIIQAALVGTL